MKTMSGIKEDLIKLATDYIQDGYETLDEARNALYEANPDFRRDVIFNQLFPLLFNVAMCKIKLNQS